VRQIFIFTNYVPQIITVVKAVTSFVRWAFTYIFEGTAPNFYGKRVLFPLDEAGGSAKFSADLYRAPKGKKSCAGVKTFLPPAFAWLGH
jgi:hypothetical protein